MAGRGETLWAAASAILESRAELAFSRDKAFAGGFVGASSSR